MKTISKLATAAAIAAAAVGSGAATASAYSISGGAYVGAPAGADHTFAIAGAYAYSCPASLTSFSGTATGADTTSFTPYYGGANACEFFGLPVTVAQSGTWSLRVTGGPDASGWYTGEFAVPLGTTTSVSVPIMGCSFVVAGPQTLQHGLNGNSLRMRNIAGGVDLEASLFDIAYTASNCPFASGADGTYFTNGAVTIPGITIS